MLPKIWIRFGSFTSTYYAMLQKELAN